MAITSGVLLSSERVKWTPSVISKRGMMTKVSMPFLGPKKCPPPAHPTDSNYELDAVYDRKVNNEAQDFTAVDLMPTYRVGYLLLLCSCRRSTRRNLTGLLVCSTFISGRGLIVRTFGNVCAISLLSKGIRTLEFRTPRHSTHIGGFRSECKLLESNYHVGQ